MKTYKIVVLRSINDLTWEEILGLLDIIGLWHYTRSRPDIKDYEISSKTYNHNSNGKEIVSIYKIITPIFGYLLFKINTEDWTIRVQQKDHSLHTFEGRIDQSFRLTEYLLNIGAIKIKSSKKKS